MLFQCQVPEKATNVLFSTEAIWGILVLFQTGIGFTGNLLPFIIYMYILFIQPYQKKSLDVILTHLTLADVRDPVYDDILWN